MQTNVNKEIKEFKDNTRDSIMFNGLNALGQRPIHGGSIVKSEIGNIGRGIATGAPSAIISTAADSVLNHYGNKWTKEDSGMNYGHAAALAGGGIASGLYSVGAFNHAYDAATKTKGKSFREIAKASLETANVKKMITKGFNDIKNIRSDFRNTKGFFGKATRLLSPLSGVAALIPAGMYIYSKLHNSNNNKNLYTENPYIPKDRLNTYQNGASMYKHASISEFPKEFVKTLKGLTDAHGPIYGVKQYFRDRDVIKKLKERNSLLREAKKKGADLNPRIIKQIVERDKRINKLVEQNKKRENVAMGATFTGAVGYGLYDKYKNEQKVWENGPVEYLK